MKKIIHFYQYKSIKKMEKNEKNIKNHQKIGLFIMAFLKIVKNCDFFSFSPRVYGVKI